MERAGFPPECVKAIKKRSGLLYRSITEHSPGDRSGAEEIERARDQPTRVHPKKAARGIIRSDDLNNAALAVAVA